MVERLGDGCCAIDETLNGLTAQPSETRLPGNCSMQAFYHTGTTYVVQLRLRETIEITVTSH